MRLHLNTKPGENLVYPDFGIDLEVYQGRANTKELGMEIARLIKFTLARVTDIYESELKVTPFPISRSAIAFKIEMSTLPQHKGMLMYDLRDNRIRSLNFQDGNAGSITEVHVTAPPTLNNTIK